MKVCIGDRGRSFGMKRLLVKIFFVVFVLFVFLAPSIARAETRVYVTASIGGGIIAGGVYVIWSIIYSGRIAGAPAFDQLSERVPRSGASEFVTQGFSLETSNLNEYAGSFDKSEYGFSKTHVQFREEDVSEFRAELLKIRF